MTNSLTGDYDAVVEVSVKTIDGILATLHQNGISQDDSPSFLHSFATRVGDQPKVLLPEIWKLLQWMQQAGLISPGSGGGSHGGISKKSPPGVSAGLNDAVKQAHQAQAEFTTPGGVRGTAQVQVCTPRVTFPAGSISEVTAHVELRANYVPDPGTLNLPEPVHGEVEITFKVQPGVADGVDVLDVQIPNDANKIQFKSAPGTGLDYKDVQTIELHIRNVLRDGFEPINVELPAGFRFNRFKALGSGAGQAVALPVQLGGGPQPPAAAINSISNLFLGSADQFAIGISKEYILSLVQASLDAIKASHPQFTVSGFLGTATYTTNFTTASATWYGNKIRIQIQGNSTTPTWWAPNVNAFGITQDLVLHLDESAQTIDVVPSGDPAVSVNVGGPFGGLIEDEIEPTVKSSFISQRNSAIAAAESQIQQVLSGAGSIESALHAFDDSAEARYKALDTNADGAILRGKITTKLRYQVIVKFTETGDGKGFTALKSWIPAGAIDRFEWSWLEKSHPFIPWSTQVKAVHDEHRFVLPKPDGVSVTAQICLHLEGRQVYPGVKTGVQVISIGDDISVEAGENCSSRNDGPGMIWMMPSWWDVIMTPIWLPDPPPEMVLDEAISAHVSMLSDPGERETTGANAIVHFAGLEGGRPFDMLDGPLSAFGGGDVPMALVLVVPKGVFAARRAEVESRLGELNRFGGTVTITEDYQDGWSRTFGVEKMPATFLMNARGEFAWGSAGAFDPDALTKALEENLVSGPTPVPHRVQLRIQEGDRAPDFLMDVVGGSRIALRKLRGRRVLLNFWQSWSRPCVRELDNLQKRQSEAGRDALAVFAINGGEPRERVEVVARGHEPGISLVADPRQEIARNYGVSCWPTTVSITESGIVDDIQFGLVADRPAREQAT